MVVATGFFDGVHIGHRLVVEQLVEAARERGGGSAVVTFWPHPRNVLQNDARNLRLLSSLGEKRAMLESLGVDRVEVLPFTKEFSKLSTRDYLKDYLMDRLGARTILLGYDNRMGSDPQTPDSIQAIAESLGLEVLRAGSLSTPQGVVVSSTKIRQAVSSGDVAGASAMLGYDYSLLGVVVTGDQLGRTIGFPTANMQLYEPLKLLPANGVYKVEVKTLGKTFQGMCNIGVRPTVRTGCHRTVETNIFGFDEDIYGLDIQVTFLRKIRDERKFATISDLRERLQADRRECLEDQR